MTTYIFRADQADATSVILPGAVVVGDVHLEAYASVWFNAVIRGDTEPITIGVNSNVQDLCMIHADPGYPVQIGENVTIGHRAIIHGAQIASNALIGMGAILLNGAQVAEESIVGAGALLTEGKVFPPRSLILGSPARVVRELTDNDLKMIADSARHYVERAQIFRKETDVESEK